jgi:hypothetical protein
MSKSYLYVASYYDKKGREVSIKDKKIGTTTTPKEREKSLNYTKGPIGTTFIKLYEFDGKNTATTIEKSIFHNLLSDRNTDGEWFNDEDESVVEMVNTTIKGLSTLFNINEIQLEGSSSEETQTIRSAASKLLVIFNGNPIIEKNAKEIYLKTLQEIGLDKILTIESDSIIRDSNPDYRFIKVDDYFVNINFSNNSKYTILSRISETLNLDLKVELN